MAYRPKDTQERILHRLKIAHGQLETVIKMVEDHAYCIDVINQSLAVQSALKEADALLLEHHLQTCVVDLFKNGQHKKAIEELLLTYKKRGR